MRTYAGENDAGCLAIGAQSLLHGLDISYVTLGNTEVGGDGRLADAFGEE